MFLLIYSGQGEGAGVEESMGIKQNDKDADSVQVRILKNYFGAQIVSKVHFICSKDVILSFLTEGFKIKEKITSKYLF